MTTANLYGHQVELEPDDGGIVAEVLVVARHVRIGDDGLTEDRISISATDSTGQIMQLGMLTAALDYINDPEDDL